MPAASRNASRDRSGKPLFRLKIRRSAGPPLFRALTRNREKP